MAQPQADRRDQEMVYMRYIAIDPGTTQTAYVVYEAGSVLGKGIYPNEKMRDFVWHLGNDLALPRGFPPEKLYIEMIASYGMPVGREVFETCVWIGRFIEAWQGPYTFVYRKDVKLALCGSSKAKDSNIRQALLDKFGPGKEIAIGKKASPGPLYGVSKDVWAALAVAVFVEKTIENNRR